MFRGLLLLLVIDKTVPFVRDHVLTGQRDISTLKQKIFSNLNLALRGTCCKSIVKRL